MFLKEFEIRWSDLDANRHLANSAYINFMSHTRMAYLGQLGFNQKTMAQHNIGPVVFYEHVYYFKEVFPGKPVQVSLGFKGMSKDGMFFEFQHDFYDSDGTNFARCEMMGAWIDLKERKLTALPQVFLDAFDKMEKVEEFRILTKEDTRRFAKTPKNLV
ncbi:thioesterase family protein [Allomuricauda sp. SCSIO 65647]|uniref:acyl-CoA thioesterase n=1 Tax=Allomuricauda sp. SCSIO 65647 TaxID=2908843 RepID=UPI001F2BFE7B|nr:thioesterase family protein [Muricauda sp. SCSIO 65647]UJH66055.1 thioesterase family protein [Muricauda sp. SCSIO 65647]